MEKTSLRRKRLRQKLAATLKYFKHVKLARLLERLHALPTESPFGNLRSKALGSACAFKRWGMKESFNDLTPRQMVFIWHLKRAGLPYREIEPVVGLKGMNGMNSYRALKSEQAKMAIKAWRKKVA